MNPLVTAPSLSSWLDHGRQLLTERTNVEWRLADWIADGRAQFGHQVEFDFLAEQLGITSSHLRTAAKVAVAFPPSHRATDLPYEVHAYIAALPDDRRLDVLARASTERWGERQAKAAVVEHRHATALFDDEDAETRLAVEIIRAWNRAPVESRRYAFELIDPDTLAAIDEDQTRA